MAVVDLPGEIWKPITGQNKYMISTFGRVKRIACTITYKNGHVSTYKERLLKPDILKLNYKRYTFSDNNIQTRDVGHRLVAKHFIPNPENKPCVNHIDGNPSNNHVDNLEWVTYSENEKHSYDVLGKVNPQRKLTDDQVREVCKLHRSGIPSRKVAKMFGVTKLVVLNISNGKSYKEVERDSNREG